MSSQPRLIVTGASGFVGRRVIETFQGRWRIEAVDRHSQEEARLPDYPGVTWHKLDIAEPESLARCFRGLRDSGGAQVLLHLAGYYDFTGDPHPEYERTNVRGTELVLAAARELGLERFFFASSVAACSFPAPGKALDEASPPDGDHIYAASKRRGEELMRAATGVPTAILRFAALFSDWCEYGPLAVFLGTWLGQGWNARVLGGRGRSAIPYLHVRDLMVLLERAIERRRELAPAEVLLASPDGAVSHRDLYRAATAWGFGTPRRAFGVPKPVAALGMTGRLALCRLRGREPFERPWMARYIDLALTVDARRTRERLGWLPRPRLSVLRRLPFLLENRRSDPAWWFQRNQAALHLADLPPVVRLIRLLEAHAEEIRETFTRALVAREGEHRLAHYAAMAPTEHSWNHRLLMHSLLVSARDGERGTFMAYCRDLAERRVDQGVPLTELREALATFERVCRGVLAGDPESLGLELLFRDRVAVTLEFGIDAVEEVYERRLGIATILAAERPDGSD